MINFPTFSDQWIKNDIKTYENNRKIASEEQDGCTNGFFYQNVCISKLQFILEEEKETMLDILQYTARFFWSLLDICFN